MQLEPESWWRLHLKSVTLPDSEGPEFHKWTWLSGGVRLPSSYEIGIVDLKVRDYWDRKRESSWESGKEGTLTIGAKKNTWPDKILCGGDRLLPPREGAKQGLCVRTVGVGLCSDWSSLLIAGTAPFGNHSTGDFDDGFLRRKQRRNRTTFTLQQVMMSPFCKPATSCLQKTQSLSSSSLSFKIRLLTNYVKPDLSAFLNNLCVKESVWREGRGWWPCCDPR